MSTIPNQPESTAGFCQNCGKPLSPTDVRSVAGMIYCEPCLAQRLGVPYAPGQTPTGEPVPGQPYTGPYAGAPYPPAHNSPFLAGMLGFIPGVGAMYNGQVIKGLIHVFVFIALVSATSEANHSFDVIFGLMIPAWIFYQVFDAYQTALALQRGLPVPDPLGLNQIAARFGLPQHQQPGAPPYAGQPPPTYTPPTYAPPVPPIPPMPPMPGFVAQPMDYVPPPPPPVDFNPGTPGLLDEPTHRTLPAGAIVLVGLGVFFLLGTAGILSTHWLGRSWPLVLIGLGVYIALKNINRTRGGVQ